MKKLAHLSFRSTTIGTAFGGFKVDADGVLDPQPPGLICHGLVSTGQFAWVDCAPQACAASAVRDEEVTSPQVETDVPPSPEASPVALGVSDQDVEAVKKRGRPRK